MSMRLKIATPRPCLVAGASGSGGRHAGQVCCYPSAHGKAAGMTNYLIAGLLFVCIVATLVVLWRAEHRQK